MENKELLSRIDELTTRGIDNLKELSQVKQDIILTERKIKDIESDIRMNIMLNPEQEIGGQVVKLSNDNLRNSYINSIVKPYKIELDDFKAMEERINSNISIYYAEKFRLESILRVKELEKDIK